MSFVVFTRCRSSAMGRRNMRVDALLVAMIRAEQVELGSPQDTSGSGMWSRG